MDLTVKKSTCERYDLRWGKGWHWAIFTVDERGGLFNCLSDYGDYNYAWPNHGRESFKHFILELAKDPWYFLGKVSKETHFDYEETIKNWKKIILRERRENSHTITKQIARDAWDFICDLDSNYTNSADILAKEMYESRAISNFCCEPWYTFEIDMNYPPNARVFANEVMPMFAEELKKELGLA